MRKKVIAIHASSRKRNTYHLLENLREELAAYDIDVEFLCCSSQLPLVRDLRIR